MESYSIRRLRAEYLQAISEYRREGRNIVFMDETYINASHTTSMGWFGKNGEGLKAPVSRGRRLIVVHAGGERGFVKDALLIFTSGAKSGDYHDDMNSKNFLHWAKSKLLPNLPAHSVVVLDNAPYHNVRTEASITTATKKADMVSWLAERDVLVSSALTKPQVYDLVKQKKAKVLYKKLR